MTSKAQKLRAQLGKINEKHDEFERNRKELEAEMARGRENMGKIKRGLRNNEILEEPILDIPSPHEVNTTPKRQTQNRFKKTAPIPTVDSNPTETITIPNGVRVSDWCFNGALDSMPPVVKSNEIYENIRLLGRGSYGAVYLVKNVDDNKKFANKTIFCEKEEYMKDTLREVKYLRLSRHPCIIDISDVFITAQPRVLNIITSFCESGDLGKVIEAARKNKQNIAETQIIKWSMQISLALHFIHENGMVHRDLKPNNVMLTEGGDLVKVADFGLAFETAKEQYEAFSEAGTPAYTAPEMIQGLKYSYPADCFSFGVMLHEFLRLELPFRGNSTAELVRSILQDEPPPTPSHYSEDIKLICLALLQKDPSRRLGFAGVLMHPLFQSKVASFPTAYRPKSLEERVRRAHMRQLMNQIDTMPSSKNSCLQSVSALLHESASGVTKAGNVNGKGLSSSNISTVVRTDSTVTAVSEGTEKSAKRGNDGKRSSVTDNKTSLSEQSLNMRNYMGMSDSVSALGDAIVAEMDKVEANTEDSLKDDIMNQDLSSVSTLPPIFGNDSAKEKKMSLLSPRPMSGHKTEVISKSAHEQAEVITAMNDDIDDSNDHHTSSSIKLPKIDGSDKE